MSHDDIYSEADALALARRLAEETGLELLPVAGRERTQAGFVRRMRLVGRVSERALTCDFRHTDAGPASELSATLGLELALRWVDLKVVGRTMPAPVLIGGPYGNRLMEEFSIRTGDEVFAAALLAGEVGGALITANLAGYSPRFDHDELHLSARALDGPAAGKFLRHALRIASLLDARRTSIAKPARESALLAVLEPLARDMNGRLDRDALQLQLRRVEGTLVVNVVHHGYEQWSTVIELVFERPLPAKLTIAPTRAFYQNWFRPDITTDDGAFDRAFDVRGEPAERVIQILGERSRRALEALVKSAKDVLVTQDGINLQLPGVILDFERMKKILNEVLSLAEALTAHQSGPQAYR